MKKIISLCLICLVIHSGLTAQQNQYSRIRIPYPHYQLIAGFGIPLEEALVRPGAWAQLEISQVELQRIEDAGLPFEILVSDLSAYYANRARESKSTDYAASSQYPVPSGFQLGTMGGHLTYQEAMAALDSMATQYPNLITQRQPIGNYLTTQGNPIYWVKISDNPNLDEPEPAILYTSLHHAREPAGLMALVYYMHYLLENYSTDQEIQYLVDNREMYFILVLNPDGYLYNQATNPYGGGMWRKNLRNNGNGNFGVDLNRNYGFKWGLDDVGSSPFPQDETYRGPSAFSEPELQAVRDFCATHSFRLALNYHTYSNLLIYPWGWTDQQVTHDDDAFQAISRRMTRDNRYTYGMCSTILYPSNGGSDDWMYGDTVLKPKILSFTPELGSASDGFWASPSRIIPICQENMIQNLIGAHVVGEYADATDLSGPFLPALNAYLPFELQRLGLDSAQNYTISLQGISGVLNTGTPLSFQGMTYLEKRQDSISYQLDPALLPGQKVKFLVGVGNGQYTHYDTITKIYGQPIPIFQDHASNMQHWSTTAWGLTNNYFVSAPYSFADSPSGNYLPNINSHITLNHDIDLTTASFAMLSFNARWAIEPGWDYVQVLLSKDNGATWLAVGGKYSKPASDYQPLGQLVYDGFQTDWIQEYIDLEHFLGYNIRIRFTFFSDNFVQYEGFYLDDVMVSSIDISAGIPPQEEPKSLHVFPNPSKDYITIARGDLHNTEEVVDIFIYSAMGNRIKQMPVSHYNANIQLDITDLAPGLYFCILTSKDGFIQRASFLKQ